MGTSGVWTSIGASISALGVATWTLMTWVVAEKPKYDPRMSVEIDDAYLAKWDDISCRFFIHVKVRNPGLSTVMVTELNYDFALADMPTGGNEITRIDYFSVLNDKKVANFKLDGSAGKHSPFIHRYPPNDQSQNGLDFIIPKTIGRTDQMFVYRVRASTDQPEADNNAFSWDQRQFICE